MNVIATTATALKTRSASIRRARSTVELAFEALLAIRSKDVPTDQEYVRMERFATKTLIAFGR